MHETRRARWGAPLRTTACGLLLVGVLALPAAALAAPAATAPQGTGTAAVAPAAARPAVSTTLSSHVTDDAGLLDDFAAQQVVDQLAADGVGLWIVTMKDSSQTAEEYANKAWSASGFGTSDLLLVINTPDSGENTYAFGGSAQNSVWSDSTISSVKASIYQALSQRDFDGAVAAIGEGASGSGSGTASSSSDSSSGMGGLGIAAAAVAAGGGIAYVVSRRRKAAGGGGSMSPTGTQAPPATIEELRTQAGNALVAADDAVRAADEELSYAQAQFGLSATDAFTKALEGARAHLARSFELRKILDDSVPETEAQQRQMYTEIIDRCGRAIGEIKAQEQTFAERRGIEANLPASIAETAQRADETQQAITAANTLLVTLHATYPPSALTSVSEAPAQAERLLAAGRTALDQARASQEAGQQSTAVEQVRIAQGSIAQAGQLAAQVTGARERLAGAASELQTAIASISSDLVDAQRLAAQVPAATLQPLVADAEAAVAEGRAASGPTATGDPLAALDHLARAEAAIDAALAPARAREENDSRARASLGSRLARLGSQVDAVTSYITTHRGAVGSSARTALAEASRHLAAATAVQATDPQAALSEVAAGEPLVAQAQALAEADVRSSQDSWGSGGGRGSGNGGIDVGSLILGGILLGGNRGYGGWGGHHHDGPFGGGFGGGGPFGGGGFGGGGFGGGGGGFGGGGGRF